jgi:glutamine amidotransferase
VLTIVDYGRGNLFSLGATLRHLGVAFAITDEPEKIRNADRIILPGVGAFGDAMQALAGRNLIEPLRQAVEKGTPLLGICLGMQLLASRSEEFGAHEGDGFIPGPVSRLPNGGSADALRIPNVGWRRIDARAEDPFVGDVKEKDMYYFVHSYAPVPDDPDHVSATIPYNGANIPVVIRREKIMGTQFHPEKSGASGFRLLQSFLDRF